MMAGVISGFPLIILSSFSPDPFEGSMGHMNSQQLASIVARSSMIMMKHSSTCYKDDGCWLCCWA